MSVQLGTTRTKRKDYDNDTPEVDAQKKRRIEWIVKNHVIKELQPVEVPLDVFYLIFNNIPINDMIAQQLYTVNKKAGEDFQDKYLWESQRYSSYIHELPDYDEYGVKQNKKDNCEDEDEDKDEDDEEEADPDVEDRYSLQRKKNSEGLVRINAVVKKELPAIRRGDVIRLGGSDYRNDGKVMWDGEKVIALDYKHGDDYGICPPVFQIDQFPSTCYFKEAIDHNSSVWVDLKQYTKLEATETTMLRGTKGTLFKLQHKTKPAKILYLFQTESPENFEQEDDEESEGEDEEDEDEDEDGDKKPKKKAGKKEAKEKDEEEEEEEDDGMPKLNVNRKVWEANDLSLEDDIPKELQERYPNLSKHNFVNDYE